MVGGWGGGENKTFFVNPDQHFWFYLRSGESKREDKRHATKPTSTKGGDIRQTLRARSRRKGTYDKADEHEGRGHTTNPKNTKGGDVRQTCRPLIKPYEHEGRGHTTNPTSTKGGDIRQTSENTISVS